MSAKKVDLPNWSENAVSAVRRNEAEAEEKVNAYACARIKSDRLHANEGRPDQDMDPGARALKGAP